MPSHTVVNQKILQDADQHVTSNPWAHDPQTDWRQLSGVLKQVEQCPAHLQIAPREDRDSLLPAQNMDNSPSNLSRKWCGLQFTAFNRPDCILRQLHFWQRMSRSYGGKENCSKSRPENRFYVHCQFHLQCLTLLFGVLNNSLVRFNSVNQTARKYKQLINSQAQTLYFGHDLKEKIYSKQYFLKVLDSFNVINQLC